MSSNQGYFLRIEEQPRKYNLAQWHDLCRDNEHPPKKGQSRAPRRQKGKFDRNRKPDESDAIVDATEFTTERCIELESKYWKTVTYNSPLYGADMLGSLFTEETKSWNVSDLGDILHKMPARIPGVNSAYLYFGMWKSTFGWHLEDMDLYSINYIHFGAPKCWYSISQKDEQKFFDLMKEMWPSDFKKCPEFLRHKTFHVSPSYLREKGISVNRLFHYQHEFVLTFPFGYHSGFNYGYNCAESVNFADDEWIPIGMSAQFCKCSSHSVGIDVARWFTNELKQMKENGDQNGSLSKKRKSLLSEEERKPCKVVIKITPYLKSVLKSLQANNKPVRESTVQ